MAMLQSCSTMAMEPPPQPRCWVMPHEFRKLDVAPPVIVGEFVGAARDRRRRARGFALRVATWKAVRGQRQAWQARASAPSAPYDDTGVVDAFDDAFLQQEVEAWRLLKNG